MYVEIGKAHMMGKGLRPDEYTGCEGEVLETDATHALLWIRGKGEVYFVFRRLTPIA